MTRVRTKKPGRISAWCRRCKGVTPHDLHEGSSTNTIGKCRRRGCGEWHGACSPTYVSEGTSS